MWGRRLVVALAVSALGAQAAALASCSKDEPPFDSKATDPGSDAGPYGAYGQACEPGALDLAGCPCHDGTPPRDCFDGDAKNAGVGTCALGKQECATGTWARCKGAVHPQGGICDGKDHLCNGRPSDGCDPCIGMEMAPGCGKDGGATESCTPGEVLVVAPNTHGCADQGTKVEVLYCDATETWQCFPADDCKPDACKACLEDHCSAQIAAGSTPSCKDPFGVALAWLEGCGPDRTAFFVDLQSKCDAVGQLNDCKFMYCTQNATCSYF